MAFVLRPSCLHWMALHKVKRVLDPDAWLLRGNFEGSIYCVEK
jgi:hypothetical protein